MTPMLARSNVVGAFHSFKKNNKLVSIYPPFDREWKPGDSHRLLRPHKKETNPSPRVSIYHLSLLNMNLILLMTKKAS